MYAVATYSTPTILPYVFITLARAALIFRFPFLLGKRKNLLLARFKTSLERGDLKKRISFIYLETIYPPWPLVESFDLCLPHDSEGEKEGEIKERS